MRRRLLDYLAQKGRAVLPPIGWVARRGREVLLSLAPVAPRGWAVLLPIGAATAIAFLAAFASTGSSNAGPPRDEGSAVPVADASAGAATPVVAALRRVPPLPELRRAPRHRHATAPAVTPVTTAVPSATPEPPPSPTPTPTPTPTVVFTAPAPVAPPPAPVAPAPARPDAKQRFDSAGQTPFDSTG